MIVLLFQKFSFVTHLNDVILHPSDPDQLDKDATAYRYKFVLLSEDGKLKFGCRDDSDRRVWVQWIYRATGQSYQPSLDTQGEKKCETDFCSGTY